MRLANLANRLTLLRDGLALDVETASEGRFASDPQAVYDEWDAFLLWANGAQGGAPFDPSQLGPPVPRPRQVFALGLNYALHAQEAGLDLPPMPLTFTKFPSCITGPDADVQVATDRVDWEVELVAVIGRHAHRLPAADAWDHVAGVTVGQDLSARDIQMTGSPPQFSLGKSFPGFGPTGPVVVTPDELADPDDIGFESLVDGEPLQRGRTSEMIFPVPDLVEYISSVCPLLPGDLIFTGTPAGVGNRMQPPRFLAPGQTLVSRMEHVGEIRQRFH